MNKTFTLSEKGTDCYSETIAVYHHSVSSHRKETYLIRVKSLILSTRRKKGRTVGRGLFMWNLGSQANIHHSYKMASRELYIIQ